jgi:hypothetical protein
VGEIPARGKAIRLGCPLLSWLGLRRERCACAEKWNDATFQQSQNDVAVRRLDV